MTQESANRQVMEDGTYDRPTAPPVRIASKNPLELERPIIAVTNRGAGTGWQFDCAAARALGWVAMPCRAALDRCFLLGTRRHRPNLLVASSMWYKGELRTNRIDRHLVLPQCGGHYRSEELLYH
jgi:hypothetical protein